MAVRAGLCERVGRRTVKVTWTGLLNGDTGAWVTLRGMTDKTVQVKGTWGTGGSLSMEGSNDGSTAFVVNDTRGETNPATLTAASTAILTLAEHGAAIRPNVTAGDGTTNLTLILTAVGS